MESANPTFNETRMFPDLLTHCAVCLSQEVDAQWEWPPPSATDLEMEILTDDHTPSNSNNNFRRSPATCHTSHFGPIPFRNTLFLAIQPLPIDLEGIPPILHTISDSPVPFQQSNATLPRSFGLNFPNFPAWETILTPSSKVVKYLSYPLLNTGQIRLQQRARCIHETKAKILGLCPTLWNFTGENPIAVPDFLANLKETFDNCSVCESKGINVHASMLSYSVREVSKTYTTNEMSTDAHVCQGARPVVINALKQHFLT